MKCLILIILATFLYNFVYAGKLCRALLDDSVLQMTRPTEPIAFLQRNSHRTEITVPSKLPASFLELLDKLTESPNAVSNASLITALEKHIPLDSDFRIYFKPGLGGEARLNIRRTKDNKWSVSGRSKAAFDRNIYKDKYDFDSRLNEDYRHSKFGRYTFNEKEGLDQPTQDLAQMVHEYLRWLHEDLLEGELTVTFFEEATLWKRRFLSLERAADADGRNLLFQTFAKVKGYRLLLSKVGLQAAPGLKLTEEEEKLAAAVHYLIDHELGLDVSNEFGGRFHKPKIVHHSLLLEGFETNSYSLKKGLYNAMESYGLTYENGVWKKESKLAP